MVELETMYPGIAFSPQTKLTAAINETDTVISVESTAGLPDGPNYATIGTDENAETIYYAIKLPTQLSGCVRGVEGLAKAWTIGDVLGRNFTAKDYEAILNNLLALKTSADSLSAEVEGLQTALDGKAPSSHNQAASTITEGTFPTTAIYAKTGTDYTTARIRNIKASTTDLAAETSSLSSGDIYIVYE